MILRYRLIQRPNPCPVPESERQALIDLFNANSFGAGLPAGQEWEVTDPNSPVCDWFGITVNNGHVTEIALPSRLFGSLPSSLANLSFLEVLDITNGGLTQIFIAELFNITSLRVLRAADHQTGEVIPNNFCRIIQFARIGYQF